MFSAFRPEDVAVLQEAFNRAADTLRGGLASREPADAEAILDRLSKIVMELGASGERDPAAIMNIALARLPPMTGEVANQ